jgi:hypothetical protein
MGLRCRAAAALLLRLAVVDRVLAMDLKDARARACRQTLARPPLSAFSPFSA